MSRRAGCHLTLRDASYLNNLIQVITPSTAGSYNLNDPITSDHFHPNCSFTKFKKVPTSLNFSSRHLNSLVHSLSQLPLSSRRRTASEA